MARSSGSKRIASSAMNSGTAAIRIAASDEETCCSPAAISGNGIDDLDQRVDEPASASGRAASGSRPARLASTSRIAAASVTRTQAMNAGGMPPSTATLMNR